MGITPGIAAARTAERQPLVSVQNISHFFKRGVTGNLLVLDHVDLNLVQQRDYRAARPVRLR